MSDEQQVPEEPIAEPAAPEPAPAPEPEAAEASAPADTQEGKVFAILSYALSFVSLPFFLVPLIMRNNAFALYHAKQSLMIWLAGIAVSIVSIILTAICIGPILGLVGGVFLLVLNVMGLVNAAKCEAKPLPLIGKWAEDWFKGIQKV